MNACCLLGGEGEGQGNRPVMQPRQQRCACILRHVSAIEGMLHAQEVYYEVPELRHIVITRVEDPTDIQELPENTDLTDIQNDPDYDSLGWNKYQPANIRYKELIPYLVKSNQEQQIEIEILKTEITGLKEMMNTLINAKSFSDFKKSIG